MLRNIHVAIIGTVLSLGLSACAPIQITFTNSDPANDTMESPMPTVDSSDSTNSSNCQNPSSTQETEICIKAATEMALYFLDLGPTSRDGLALLIGPDFSWEVKTAAVNRLNVDWSDQAAKSAQMFLDQTKATGGNLTTSDIRQLLSGAFTDAEVEYAMRNLKE